MKSIGFLVCCILLGGCHSAVAYRWAAPPQPQGWSMTILVPEEVVAGAAMVGVVVGDANHYYILMPDGTRQPYYGKPEADPARRINVQDCTRPVDPGAGNLMCK